MKPELLQSLTFSTCICFIGKKELTKYLAKRVVAYNDIERKDIGTFVLEQALKLEQMFGFNGLVYEEIMASFPAEKDWKALSFDIKDILFLAALKSQKLEV